MEISWKMLMLKSLTLMKILFTSLYDCIFVFKFQTEMKGIPKKNQSIQQFPLCNVIWRQFVKLVFI
jgi:hypothetical protein